MSLRPPAPSSALMKRGSSVKEWMGGGTLRSRDKPAYGDPEKP